MNFTPKASVNKLIKVIQGGTTITDWNGNTSCIMNINGKDWVVDKPKYEAAELVIEATKFVSDYREKNGTKAYLAERLRNGYIGELRHENGVEFIQSIRGKPYGTVVAIPTENDIVVGMSYMDPEDANSAHPIVGLYIALKRALDGKKDGKVKAEKRFIKSRARKQIEHFEKRCLAFFHPEEFSYSRGKNPVTYENYDEIHARRAKILGK